MSEKVCCTLTVMCLVRDGTRVLLQNRNDSKWPGMAFPGGHVEYGESISEAVIREVYEETGLKIDSPRLVGLKDWCRDDGGRYIVFLYVADSFTGELRPSDEGEVMWVEREWISENRLADNFLPMMRVFEESDKEMFWRGDGWVYM